MHMVTSSSRFGGVITTRASHVLVRAMVGSLFLFSFLKPSGIIKKSVSEMMVTSLYLLQCPRMVRVFVLRNTRKLV